ncbi:Tetraspanin family protein [Rhynchospora pubera]|uniref:Tetraspanin family protein n=1 Tax=Rhynchospora pubera TaxID=906938 RepID=A0AAV8DBC2_9POAL|nr:Tetraspanin family protein [Rhynchospora pubera]
MYRRATGPIGTTAFITFLLGIPILAGGIWLSSAATDCIRFLQLPLIILGVTLMAISLFGFSAACYGQLKLIRFFLFLLFLFLFALLFFIIFAYAVTDKGKGQVVTNRSFLEYLLNDYSGWLKDKVADGEYWEKVNDCLHRSGECGVAMARYVRDPNSGLLVPESADAFYQRKLSPIESGCCKPPTSCGYTYVNETVWNPVPGVPATDPDCTRWSNDQQVLCYECDSCKAGVLATTRRHWRKVSKINIVVLVLLVILYFIGCLAYRHAKRAHYDETYGVNRMSKATPSIFRF